MSDSLTGTDTQTEPEHQPGIGGLGISLLYGMVIFLSAYLLFQVQPLISKSILPWFGGTPSVWTTCMLFFQLLLFAGYLYAHLVSTKLTPPMQLLVHMLLMGAALTASVLPDDSWKPTGAENPIRQIVLTLSVSIGLPFLVLSSTGPLLQNWFSQTLRGRSPYHLYSLSNVGSLLGLLLYPIFVEVRFDLSEQGELWKTGFILFTAGCVICGTFFVRTEETVPAINVPVEDQGKRLPGLLWFLLAAVPSIMLLATTNEVCQDVASIPFLWVIPLTLYLVSFILSFAGERWYLRRTCLTLLPLSLLVLMVMMLVGGEVSIFAQLATYFTALFLTAMCCHGELVRLQPPTAQLTSFYLWMSAGGAAGGIFVGAVAPYVFNLYLEMHVGILLTLLLMGVVLCRQSGKLWWQMVESPGIVFLLIAGAAFPLLFLEVSREIRGTLYTSRDFYGVLRVRDYDLDSEWKLRTFLNGRILHGSQFLDPAKKRWPPTYYGYESGIGRLLRTVPDSTLNLSRSIGVVGLGAGTVAAYGDDNDEVTYYEINEKVIETSGAGARVYSVAGNKIPNCAAEEEYFTYIRDFPGDTRIVLGDGRLALERANNEDFDILVLDAFSSDAVPAHLLTTEAFAVYLRHLNPDGVLAVNITNRHFNLAPVIMGITNEFDLVSRYVNDDPATHESDNTIGYAGLTASKWVLLSRTEAPFETEFLMDQLALETESVVWTDAYSNLIQLLKASTVQMLKDDVNSMIESLGGQAEL